MDNLLDFTDLAESYSDLGSSIQEQFQDVLQGWHNGDDAFEEAVCDCNSNALGYVLSYLDKVVRTSRGDLRDEAADLIEALESKGIVRLGW